MRNKQILILAGILLFAAQASAENEFFKRKPGLWEIETSSANYPASTVKQCIDEVTDKKMQEMATNMAGSMCSKNEIKKSGDTYVSASECNYGGVAISSHGVFKGNFDTDYSGEINSTYNPAMMGIKEAVTKIKAKWLGACEAGMKAGDMLMPGGMKMNIDQMMQGMKGAMGKKGH